MRAILAILISTLATQSNAFVVDLEKLDIRKLNYEYLVDDLAVGVKGIVDGGDFCARDNELYVNRAAGLKERSEYTMTYQIVLKPDGTVDIETLEPTEFESGTLPRLNTSDCDGEYINSMGFYPVASIDGADTFSEWVKKHVISGRDIGNPREQERILREFTSEKSSSQQTSLEPTFNKMFLDQMQSCWIRLSNRTANVSVTIGARFQPDGKVVASSLRLVGYSGGNQSDANVAFQAARRAVLRCQRDGYNLPRNLYDEWQYSEITFDPSVRD